MIPRETTVSLELSSELEICGIGCMKSDYLQTPKCPRPKMSSICILAGTIRIDCAKQINQEYMSVDDLKRFVHKISHPLHCLTLISCPGLYKNE